ncbi:DUF126 domain-containing protein [Pusillimonas sp. SM2304]|uniref:aconitase X swivel domain-containing protein n=1 Tax=Pusillimonas sp. SM2304 TaxID=3073241 RepID=UPI002876AE09|nr:DUF126 domain-containing protein [Pusillimonas sp. SM2304]MDS1138997.1 DUF126 domain-containing protein [Pusillimonas sp. SM2304]
MTRSMLLGAGLVRGVARGVACVSRQPLSVARINVNTGILEEPGHALSGIRLAGTILCFPEGKGSSSGSYVLMNLSERGTAPKAIVMCKPDAIVTAGAHIAGIPMVGGITPEALLEIPVGCLLRVDGSSGVISFP